MCGITGIQVFNESELNHSELAYNSVNQLGKRGPDFKNVYSTNQTSLGHARLSIIDTSENANQPFESSCGKYVIVFNGEIYNFKSLKSDLKVQGYSFKSESDTEVLLNLYIEHGKDCLHKLNGFFAFCVLNKETEELFIARDRYGIKPLYFFYSSDFFCFASELKALGKFPIEKKINIEALELYFQLGYIPSPHCILDNVLKLNPGHYLTMDKAKLETHQYYSVKIQSQSKIPSYSEAKSKVKELLEESVQKRMISDVPLGTFLSGGIDSSIVSTIASKHTKNLNTFSIGYKNEPFFDETKYANLVADKIKSNHTVFSLTNDDLFNHFNRIIDYIDEPFADSSAIAVNILCHYTKDKVTVALSGDGADELFSGYNKHKAFHLSQKKSFKNQLVKSGKPVFNLMPKSRNNPLSNKVRQLERYAKGIKLNSKQRYWLWARIQNEKEIDLLLKHKAEGKIYSKIHSCDDFNAFLLNDFNMVLEGDMLKKVDSMSMANSLEVRVPFLDHNLVDYVFSLPSEYKINSKSTKRLLKDAYRTDLPEELYTRKKHGFEVPLKKWILNDLEPLLDEIFEDDLIKDQQIFNLDRIKHLRKKSKSSNPGDSFAVLWMLIVFQKWYKNYFID